MKLDWELQACQPDHGARQDYGASHAECALTRHVQDNQGIRPSQHGCIKGRSCLTNLISFYDQVTCLVDEGKAVDIFYMDFSKAFDTTVSSWRNWLPMMWMAVLFTG